MDVFYFFVLWNLMAVLVHFEGFPNPQIVPTCIIICSSYCTYICFYNIRVVIRQLLQKNTTKRNEMSDQQPNKSIDEPTCIYYQAV